MITGLDHIAIAVPELERAIQKFHEDLGLAFAGMEDVPSAKTRTAFLPVSGTRIELVHPLNGQGPIARFLDKRGGGLHHLCFSTDDIESDMQRLADRGYRLLSDEPQPGAHGTRVVFIHPKDFDGVLIELAEHPK
ncbi:MAG: methylmalonyl-CoA epimerase [Myxococcota bacterium]